MLGSLADDYQRVMSAPTLQFLLPTTCVNFDTRTVEHLLDTNEEFLRVTFEALSDFCYQGVFYQLLLFHAPARDAVHYALNFCRKYGVENPTHAQIALFTGRNRSTVTQAIHELALRDELPG